jgi:hypothetical protein
MPFCSVPSVPSVLSVCSVLSVTGEQIQGIIGATLPKAQGQRNRSIFELCRRLKAVPALASADVATLRPIVAEWHTQALPAITTQAFIETWADFVLGWERVKYPAGQGKIDEAFQRAGAAPPPATAGKLYPADSPILLLAALCRELQRMTGNTNFFLDCRTAAGLLGVPSPTTAWRWLNVLCADGILKAGEKGSLAMHKASRFRYIAPD